MQTFGNPDALLEFLQDIFLLFEALELEELILDLLL